MRRPPLPLSPVLGGALVLAACAACASGTSAPRPQAAAPDAGAGTRARIYYWRALPGKLEEYGRYVREVAEPIDHEAQRAGAFVSVATYVSRDPAAPWTHMRVFVLRDSAQLRGLAAALDAAGARVEPDSARRQTRAAYAATLRERVGDATVEVLR
jgi:hypothetical protein